MNTYVTLVCALALACLGEGNPVPSGYGYGAPWGASVIHAPLLAPAAISTSNFIKAAPIPIIKTVAAPIITAPIIKTVAPIAPIHVAPIATSYSVGAIGHGGSWVESMGLGHGMGGLSYGMGGLGHGMGGLGHGMGGLSHGVVAVGHGMGGLGHGMGGLGHGVGGLGVSHGLGWGKGHY